VDQPTGFARRVNHLPGGLKGRGRFAVADAGYSTRAVLRASNSGLRRRLYKRRKTNRVFRGHTRSARVTANRARPFSPPGRWLTRRAKPVGWSTERSGWLAAVSKRGPSTRGVIGA